MIVKKEVMKNVSLDLCQTLQICNEFKSPSDFKGHWSFTSVLNSTFISENVFLKKKMPNSKRRDYLSFRVKSIIQLLAFIELQWLIHMYAHYAI